MNNDAFLKCDLPIYYWRLSLDSPHHFRRDCLVLSNKRRENSRRYRWKRPKRKHHLFQTRYLPHSLSDHQSVPVVHHLRWYRLRMPKGLASPLVSISQHRRLRLLKCSILKVTLYHLNRMNRPERQTQTRISRESYDLTLLPLTTTDRPAEETFRRSSRKTTNGTKQSKKMRIRNL